MPSPEPSRNLEVYFFGAGVSSAFKLPNTPALLGDLKSELTPELAQSLTSAYKFLYPDAIYEHFLPDVVDFFSSLSAFVGLGTGWPGTSLKNGRDLQRNLKRAIVHLLIDRARAVDTKLLKEHSYLAQAVRPGNVIITTNWDLLVERFAELNEIPLRLTTSSNEFTPGAVTLLKLHGSADWCRATDTTKTYDPAEYASLRELRFSRPYQMALPAKKPDELVRIRTKWSSAWSDVKSRAREPWLVTMVSGKQDELGPLEFVWRDAYSALGRARSLEIAGYSLPPDDVEVRTLLRAGMQRGAHQPAVHIRNPSPESHARFRNLLKHDIVSEYVGVPPS